MSAVVVLDRVTKLYRSYRHYHAGLKAMILRPRTAFARAKRDAVVAVDDVSLRVEEGETLGVVGRNGAGKSTLLALIGGILRPTAGRVAVNGRISPLLELGAGFSQELTGRENAVLNGILLGLRRREVEARLEAIRAFSGLGHFIDEPLKTYSSGMQMRLGFSVAVHADPRILLVDEVLAVGDAEFRARCLERIASLRAQGTTIVLVTHDLATAAAVCDRVALLERGRLQDLGEPRAVLDAYAAAAAAPARAPGG